MLVRRPEWVDRSLILRDKGTNRIRFLRGEVDKYSWVDIGSSYGLGELSAAFLWGQLERADDVLEQRRRVWNTYHERFAPLEERGLLRRPIVPDHVEHNAHLYYVLVRDLEERTRVIEELAGAASTPSSTTYLSTRRRRVGATAAPTAASRRPTARRIVSCACRSGTGCLTRRSTA